MFAFNFSWFAGGLFWRVFRGFLGDFEGLLAVCFGGGEIWCESGIERFLGATWRGRSRLEGGTR